MTETHPFATGMGALSLEDTDGSGLEDTKKRETQNHPAEHVQAMCREENSPRVDSWRRVQMSPTLFLAQSHPFRSCKECGSTDHERHMKPEWLGTLTDSAVASRVGSSSEAHEVSLGVLLRRDDG